MGLDVSLAVIGVVRTSYAEPEATPIQAALSRPERGTIVDGRYREGLAGLDHISGGTTPARLAPPD